jgi:hypothetical protein
MATNEEMYHVIDVEENKVQSANAQVSNSVIFRIKCRAQVERLTDL